MQDGASTDQTVEVLQSFGDRVAWRSEPDQGQSDALNMAVSAASGKWVSWLNADEFYLPGGLRTLLSIAEATSADVIYGDAIFVDRDGRFLRVVPQHPFDLTVLRWYGCFILSCAALFRKQALGSRPWDPALRRIMDWEMYLRLASEGAKFFYVPYPIGAFRVHDARITSAPLKDSDHERRAVRARYSIPAASIVRSFGRSLHSVRKATSGAYIRQLAARQLRNADFRWFDPAIGTSAADLLVRRAYRRGLSAG